MAPRGLWGAEWGFHSDYSGDTQTLEPGAGLLEQELLSRLPLLGPPGDGRARAASWAGFSSRSKATSALSHPHLGHGESGWAWESGFNPCLGFLGLL